MFHIKSFVKCSSIWKTLSNFVPPGRSPPVSEDDFGVFFHLPPLFFRTREGRPKLVSAGQKRERMGKGRETFLREKRGVCMAFTWDTAKTTFQNDLGTVICLNYWANALSWFIYVYFFEYFFGNLLYQRRRERLSAPPPPVPH